MPSFVGPVPYWIRHGGRVCIVKLGVAKLLVNPEFQITKHGATKLWAAAMGAGLAATQPRTADQFLPTRLISP